MVMKYIDSVEDLLQRIDALEQMYSSAWQDSSDLKLLQGLERCIELRMKLFGYDGKSQVATSSIPEQGSTLNLKILSEAALREIYNPKNEKSVFEKRNGKVRPE